jgi:hypothetical protein
VVISPIARRRADLERWKRAEVSIRRSFMVLLEELFEGAFCNIISSQSALSLFPAEAASGVNIHPIYEIHGAKGPMTSL